jgi:hypothetical protein
MYIVYGERAAREAEASITSLKRWMPGLPTLTLGDSWAERPCPAWPFTGAKFLWGRLIPHLYQASPWGRTLYLDADTEFVASPEIAFRWLDDWDFILAETPERHLLSTMVEEPEMAYTRMMFGGAWWLAYHNGGAFFWKRSERVGRFFDVWSEEWLRFQSWDPQVALLRALARSEVLFMTLPHTWNCKDRKWAKLFHHRYGSQDAQTYVRLPRERVDHHEGLPD